MCYENTLTRYVSKQMKLSITTEIYVIVFFFTNYDILVGGCASKYLQLLLTAWYNWNEKSHTFKTLRSRYVYSNFVKIYVRCSCIFHYLSMRIHTLRMCKTLWYIWFQMYMCSTNITAPRPPTLTPPPHHPHPHPHSRFKLATVQCDVHNGGSAFYSKIISWLFPTNLIPWILHCEKPRPNMTALFHTTDCILSSKYENKKYL